MGGGGGRGRPRGGGRFASGRTRGDAHGTGLGGLGGVGRLRIAPGPKTRPSAEPRGWERGLPRKGGSLRRSGHVPFSEIQRVIASR